MRKLLPFFILLLVFTAAFAAHAASVNTSIAEGQTLVTTVSPGETADYTFTPSQSGEYAFCLEETGANLQEWVCLENGVELQERYYWVSGWEGKIFILEAGKTYTFRVTCQSGFGAGSARKVHLAKVSTTTSLSIDSPSTAYVGEAAFLHPIVSHPGAVAGICQWSSSNPSVAYIEDSGSIQATVIPVAPGTTTITLTMGGLSASYTLTVAPVREIPIGGSADVNIPVAGRSIFTITPKESGVYAVWNYQQSISLTVTDAGIGNNFYGGDDSRGWNYQLKAGVTYRLYAINAPDAAGSTADTIHVEKVRPAESLSLEADVRPYSVGEAIFLRAKTDPCYGVAEGVTWSCSDPDVLQIQHADYNSGFCEALILKPGDATVTVTVGNLSASWEFSMPEPLQWYTGQANTMPLLQDQSNSATFVPEQDGYYRFTVSTDQAALLIASSNTVSPEESAWQCCSLTPGKASTVTMYLQKDVAYQLEIHGTMASGTLSGSIDYLGMLDKSVSHITVNSLPAAYEFGNDDYGMLTDGVYLFSPLGYQNMAGLTFTVHYTDGSSAYVSADSLLWDEYDRTGLTDCTWNDRPVEFCLLVDGAVPGDTLNLPAPGTVLARLRYMGVCVSFPLTVTQGHTHQMVFIEEVPATQAQDGIYSHYQCSVCEKLYHDEQGLSRIMTLEELTFPYIDNNEGGAYIPNGEDLQDTLQTLPSGSTIELSIPEGTDAVVLPADTMYTLIQQSSALSVPTAHANVLLDSVALSAILSQAAGEAVTLQVLRVEADQLSPPQQQALEQYNTAYILCANILCGGNDIHDFGSGSAVVRIPFTGDPNRSYKVIYIADDGKEEVVPCQYTEGMMEFTTGHFSMYAIVEEAGESPGYPWWIIGAVVIVFGFGAALLIKKNRIA